MTPSDLILKGTCAQTLMRVTPSMGLRTSTLTKPIVDQFLLKSSGVTVRTTNAKVRMSRKDLFQATTSLYT
jgi:hypothetical protein